MTDRIEVLGDRHPDTLMAAWDVEDALDALHSVSLLRRSDDETFNVHRLVQRSARRTVTAEHAAALVAGLRVSFVDVDDHAGRAARDALAPHVSSAIASASAMECDPTNVWWIWDHLALHLRHAGRFGEAIAEAEPALQFAESVLGDRHPDTLRTRGNLALSYWSAGRVSDAIELEERVLSERVEVLGDRHPDTLMARADLASLYRSAGRVTDAIELLRTAIEAADQLDHTHPDLESWRRALDDWQSTD
ncbi:MAG: tetratricopeptide repeat protein [Ilumatobacteraceae bacterium]